MTGKKKSSNNYFWCLINGNLILVLMSTKQDLSSRQRLGLYLEEKNWKKDFFYDPEILIGNSKETQEAIYNNNGVGTDVFSPDESYERSASLERVYVHEVSSLENLLFLQIDFLSSFYYEDP